MKSIKVKSYNKLIEDIKLDGDTGSWNGKLKKRIIDAIRLAKECRAAAKIARENGDDENAAWLEQRAEDYEQAAKNWNQDMLDDEADNEPEASETDSEEEDKPETADEAAARAQNAANRAKAAMEAAEKAAKEAKEKAEELAKNGDPEEAKEAAEKAKEAEDAANETKEAAEAAQKAADEANEAAANGDAEWAQEAADRAEAAEKQAQDSSNKAMGNSNNNTQNDSDDEDSNSTSEESDGSNDGSSKSDSDDKSDSEDDESEEDENDEESEDDTESNNSSESNDDDNSDGESSSKSKKSKSSSSNSDSDDSDDTDGNGDNDDEDEDSDDTSDSDDEPIKDPFADDEDIPSLPRPGQQGKEPRDPTVDEIIKQLGKLNGEAKRGAIAGLSDLINKKNESLTEAFKKSIREFSDEEWDEMSEETIDRIEKVKHIDTIDNVDGIKAGFKGWSDNAVARQELEDEENQNIQQDILKKRAQEDELAKYDNLETLSDFEIDFENCIRDQVELVMQEYQSYDEINPEYEDEDIIMKADVQKMLPSEVIPSVAVFFDQSSSWSTNDIAKGEQAIATVKKKYVDTGLCKLDLFYFSDTVVTNRNSSALRNGTTAWPDIIRTIRSNDPKNVIIMTDSDMNTWNNHGESYTVEGCVWWIWKNGLRAPNLPKQLRGMQHNYECEFH